MTSPPLPRAKLDESGINTEALKQAWAQFAIYDDTAKALKSSYIQARQRVVQLTLIGSIAAIGAGVVDTANTSFGFLVYLLGFFAVAAPSLASYILRDALQFVGQTEWVHNRYIAERIRQQIYYYRTKASDFAKKEDHETDDILAEKIREIRDEMRNKITLPPSVKLADIQANMEAELKAEAESGSGSKIGKRLGLLKFEDYVKERVVDQIYWYERKVYDAFERRKSFFRASQAALLIGALIGAIVGIVRPEVILVIAITNAISESIMSWSDVTLTGATYSVFSLTSQKLNDMRLDNIVKQTRAADDTTVESDLHTTFINSVETILEWERNEWYEHVLRSQADIDDRITKQLDKYLKSQDETGDLVAVSDEAESEE